MKKLFHYLAFLNFLDGILTYYGLKNDMIIEMNPLMASVYEMDAELFLFVKISLSILLYLFTILKAVPKTQLIKRLTVVASLLYTVVFGLHCLWIF